MNTVNVNVSSLNFVLISILSLFTFYCFFEPSLIPFLSTAIITVLITLILYFLSLKKERILYLVSSMYSRFNGSNKSVGLSDSGVPVYVGGLNNDGNTCFMNSVVQSFASLDYFLDWISKSISVDEQQQQQQHQNIDEAPTMNENNSSISNLRLLINDLNTCTTDKPKTYTTAPLVDSIVNGPSKSRWFGYEQEDAQEFFQQLLSQIEKDAKLKNLKPMEILIPMIRADEDDLKNIITINNNKTNEIENFKKLNLNTPFDGISATRVGCLTCGEMSGIQYNVSSSLALTFTTKQSLFADATVNLESLIDSYIEEEIIEGVECNRCGLILCRNELKSRISKTSSPQMIKLFENRLNQVNNVLKEQYIPDLIYSKLRPKQVIMKCEKSKQTYFIIPSKILSIHINRSIYDFKTGFIKKIYSHVKFPKILNFSKYTLDNPNCLNLDPRLPMKPTPTINENENENDSKNDVLYKLKGVIIHFGSHNYGHYINYRLHNDIWWRLSDESVRCVTEEEVLESQGIFMLFYELIDNKQQQLEEKNNEIKENLTNNNNNNINEDELPEIPTSIKSDFSTSSTNSETEDEINSIHSIVDTDPSDIEEINDDDITIIKNENMKSKI